MTSEACVNCIDWCCPVDSGHPTEFIALGGHGGEAAAPPPGCVAVPSDDGACIAEQKPAHAYRCGTNSDGAIAPLECIGNPYASSSCGSGWNLGYVCCP